MFRLYPKLLLSLVPDLGMVIDLTNTTKYYNARVKIFFSTCESKINHHFFINSLGYAPTWYRL